MLHDIEDDVPNESEGTQTYLPLTCYILSKDKKEMFCKYLHGIKVPRSYMLTTRRILVSMNDFKFLGMN